MFNVVLLLKKTAHDRFMADPYEPNSLLVYTATGSKGTDFRQYLIATRVHNHSFRCLKSQAFFCEC